MLKLNTKTYVAIGGVVLAALEALRVSGLLPADTLAIVGEVTTALAFILNRAGKAGSVEAELISDDKS